MPNDRYLLLRNVATDSQNRAVLAATALAVAFASILIAEEPSLENVLQRAAAYVAEFSQQLSGIVAEETYTQQVRELTTRSSAVALERLLRSDLLLVRPDSSDRYIEFRDVFEVNGKAVRDRDDRLMRLFVEPGADANQVKNIIDESARYNIGNIPRNINTPMLPLYFLQSAQQHRFKFKRARRGGPALSGYDAPSGVAATFRVSTEAWIIEFDETRRSTVIRTNDGRDFPASGRFWIVPDTGAVLMTELVMDSRAVRGVIDVSYQSEPLLGFRVPVEMRERYVTRNERVEGVATYGRFRQFQVRTDENIAIPPLPGEKQLKPPKPPPR